MFDFGCNAGCDRRFPTREALVEHHNVTGHGLPVLLERIAVLRSKSQAHDPAVLPCFTQREESTDAA